MSATTTILSGVGLSTLVYAAGYSAIWCTRRIGDWLHEQDVTRRAPEKELSAEETLRNLERFRLRTWNAAPDFTTKDYTLIQISNDVLLSRLGVALQAGGLCISNVPNGPLRIHPMSDWLANPPDNVIPLPTRTRQGETP